MTMTMKDWISDVMMSSRAEDDECIDIYEFHEKFDQLRAEKPRRLTRRKLAERATCMLEEVMEFAEAAGLMLKIPVGHDTPLTFVPDPEKTDEDQDLPLQADALIDLVYFAKGTSVMCGLPWGVLFLDVNRANMSKERGITKRGYLMDVTKPPGWVGPQTLEILKAAGYDPEAPGEFADDEIHGGKGDGK